MADIFGRNPEHYQVVRQRMKDGTWDRQQHTYAEMRPHVRTPVHDFDALGRGLKWDKELVRATQDQQAMGFLTNNLLSIQTVVDEILYTDYRLPEFVSINTSIEEGATSYGVRVQDRTGRAVRISAPGQDAPNATVSQALVPRPIFYYGLDGIWSLDELRGAMFSGVPLDTQSIEAAVMGSLETMESVALTGGGYDNTTGLINHTTTGDDAVNLQAQGANMTFTDLTSEQIRTLINGDISWVISNSMETLGRNIKMGMTVYLPGEQYDLLTTRYLGDNAERTIMRGLMEDNPWTHFTKGSPINIERLLELDAASNPGSTTDQMVVGLKHPRIAEIGVSIMPRVITILNKGRDYVAQVESKYADFWFKRPTLVRYRRGI